MENPPHHRHAVTLDGKRAFRPRDGHGAPGWYSVPGGPKLRLVDALSDPPYDQTNKREDPVWLCWGQAVPAEST